MSDERNRIKDEFQRPERMRRLLLRSNQLTQLLSVIGPLEGLTYLVNKWWQRLLQLLDR